MLPVTSEQSYWENMYDIHDSFPQTNVVWKCLNAAVFKDALTERRMNHYACTLHNIEYIQCK